MNRSKPKVRKSNMEDIWFVYWPDGRHRRTYCHSWAAAMRVALHPNEAATWRIP